MSDFARELQEMEEALWDPTTRYDPDHMDKVLAEGFVEFGRSGRIWDRHDVVSSPLEPFRATLPLPDYTVRFITNDVALATYRSEVHAEDGIVSANRSSLWRRTADGWQLEFHQGTPVQP